MMSEAIGKVFRKVTIGTIRQGNRVNDTYRINLPPWWVRAKVDLEKAPYVVLELQPDGSFILRPATPDELREVWRNAHVPLSEE